MSAPCTHVLCHEIGDGACHISADGWVVNVDDAALEKVGRVLGWPQDALGQSIRSKMDGGRDLVRMVRDQLKEPNVSATRRKQLEKMLDDLRKRGIPDPGEGDS